MLVASAPRQPKQRHMINHSTAAIVHHIFICRVHTIFLLLSFSISFSRGSGDWRVIGIDSRHKNMYDIGFCSEYCI